MGSITPLGANRMASDNRPYGLSTATALVIGGMIGSGIFILPAQIAPFGWTGVVGWIVAIGGAMLLAWLIGQLTRAKPQTDGIVPLCAEALGPVPGLLIGWAYWVANCATNAVYALAATRYLALLFPVLGATTLNTVISALAILWAITALNSGGARGVGLFQQVTTVLKVLPLVAIILILGGFMLSGGHQFHTETQAPFAPSQLTPALGVTFFAMLGFEGASVIAGLVRDPERNIARATLIGVSVTGLIYLIISTGIMLTLPPAALAQSGAPIALFIGQFIGTRAGLVIAVFGAISIIGALNCWVLVNAELPLGMARSGLLPRWLGVTNARNVPIRQLLLSSMTSTLLILTGLSRSTGGLLDFMALVTTASNLWLYAGACVAALMLRIARPFAIVGFAFSLWVIWGTGWSAISLSIALMLTALPLYWLRGAPKQPAKY